MPGVTKQDYEMIRRWGRVLGSDRSYVSEQVVQARHDRAPSDAIYRRHDGVWATVRDVSSLSTLRSLGVPVTDAMRLQAARSVVASLRGQLLDAEARVRGIEAEAGAR